MEQAASTPVDRSRTSIIATGAIALALVVFTIIFAALSGGSAAVVVATRGKPTGMLTRSDLLEYLAHGRGNSH